MDEIVFEFRNKNYGAYILRRLYNKHVTVSLLLSIFIMCASLSYPFISSFYSKYNGRYVSDAVTADLTPAQPTEKVEPPPPPPPALDIKRLIFLPPVVTEGEVPDDAGLNMEDINSSTVNNPIINVETTPSTEAPPPVLDVEPEMKIETIVQEMPVFIGGEPALHQFIADHIRYPQMAKETNVQGIVYISFVVDSGGHVIKVKLLRGIGSGCDEEALRVIGSMPDWTPGRQNGRAVNVLFNLPIVFKLAN